MILDERTSRLLEKINELCGEGGYKIAEKEELLSCFPACRSVDDEELGRILRYLEERRLIDIKYADEGVYCVCPLPEGRLYFENARERLTEGARRKRELFLTTLFASFLGAVLGGVIVCLVALFLRVG